MRKSAILISTAAMVLLSAAPASATFPGRNGLVAYGAEDGVHVMRPNGTRDRVVSQQVPAQDAAWAPRGGRIAFSSDGRIHLLNPRTRKARSFTASGADFDPTWSRQGTRIAFVRRAEGSEGVWVVRLADRRKTLLIPGDVSDAEYAPDGGSIAYTLDGDVWLAKPNGKDAQKLVDFPDGLNEPLAGSLSWAPDASELAILTTENTGPCEGCELLWTVNSDGSDLHTVTSEIRWLHSPFYSPNGRLISFCEIGWEIDGSAMFERQQAVFHHGERYVGPTCGESWQARP